MSLRTIEMTDRKWGNAVQRNASPRYSAVHPERRLVDHPCYKGAAAFLPAWHAEGLDIQQAANRLLAVTIGMPVSQIVTIY